jgi:hypothetical protein
MKKILVACNTDPNSNPRPNRMILWLKDQHTVDVLGACPFNMDGIRAYVIERSHNWTDEQGISAKLQGAARRNYDRLIGDYERVNASRFGDTASLANELANNEYDLIISHDLVLLPLLFQLKRARTRILLDAREYYPRNYNDQWFWRTMKRPVNEFLCRKYLPLCDKIITVSEGLAAEYQHVYGVDPEVVMSLPIRWDLQPQQPQADHIQIIHHGAAGRSRRTETMLEMMDHVDERFTLDLMMISTDVKYWRHILSLAEKRKNVRVIPPLPMQEIIPSTNKYDIGLFLVPPTNFNLAHTLPNKLFEFIQARLAVAIGPNEDMSQIVRKYNCGLVANNFQPRCLARELNHLTSESLMELKRHSHKAAAILNAETTGRRVREIVSELLQDC